MKLRTITMCLLVCLASVHTMGQSITPDLQNPELWRVVNRDAYKIDGDFKKGIRLSEKEGGGLMLLKNYSFSEGIIELDVKGVNKPQQSFLGIAFHVQNDSTYDAVYFRPFNFKNDETARRSRSVQYISLPGSDWPTLRENFPGQYESSVDPVPDPDDWFHVKIVLTEKKVVVFVNNAANPSLKVTRLSGRETGGLALWTGNTSGGSFAHLNIIPAAGK